MGGKGNAREIINAVDQTRSKPKWAKYFDGFSFSYNFPDVQEYEKLLNDAGLSSEYVKLIGKDNGS